MFILTRAQGCYDITTPKGRTKVAVVYLRSKADGYVLFPTDKWRDVLANDTVFSSPEDALAWANSALEDHRTESTIRDEEDALNYAQDYADEAMFGPANELGVAEPDY